MFQRVLIANRGEIACRIIRTARRLGIGAVAVFSDADRGALHVEMADEAHPIGPPPTRESYLRGERIIDAALRSGSEAIHPGYGFLSENADFAAACAAAGLVFIGPPPGAIRAMGDKSAAKSLMATAGVPLVPGFHGAEQDAGRLAEEAGRIGYPVLIKASAGGGGKGMRIVADPGDFAGALAAAQDEARASFGDDRVLVERYLTGPRHIEVQVFADALGNVVHLFERDCSIQRRHQKVVEEAPAPGMTAERRAAMGFSACEAARAIGYRGAGTVEFIAEGDNFYFMEMNTRLQVEHPVTEMITGQDLVEWQFRVAAGERLPLRQDELAITGHAIEVRVYAEDPARDYRPSTGVLHHHRPPLESGSVRVDSGVRSGDVIGAHYDPMIAKLIVWGEDRTEAARRLGRALAGYEVAGVRTNLDLLRRVSAHPAFLAGEFDTGFLLRHPEILGAGASEPPVEAVAAAVARVLADLSHAALAQARTTGDPHSPWATATGWRLNGDDTQDFTLRHGERDIPVRAQITAGGRFILAVGDRRIDVAEAGGDALALDGVRRRMKVVRYGATLSVLVNGTEWPLELVDKLAPPKTERAGADRLVAPMQGRVVTLLTRIGAAVRTGEVLLVLEAMKMQMRLTAPRDGTVAHVRIAEGDLVDDGAELITFAVERTEGPAPG